MGNGSEIFKNLQSGGGALFFYSMPKIMYWKEWYPVF